MANRNLAKSLHTITALVNVARALSECSDRDPSGLIEDAAQMLGLDGMPDVYGLKDKAAKQLAALVPSAAYSVEDSFHVHARG